MFNFGNIAEMMKQLKTMQENIEKAKEELKKENIEVEVGTGMVKVIANGMGEVVNINIDKSLLNEENAEVLKDLLISAINAAQERAREMMTKKMAEASGVGFDISKLGGLF